jgi:hypothetical protein
MSKDAENKKEGGIYQNAATAVLRQERRFLSTSDITTIAIKSGLLKSQGKTPAATMASILYGDVKKKLSASQFTRPHEGLFGLREWISEGFFPPGWVPHEDGHGLAPLKQRKQSSNSAGGGANSAGATPARRQSGRSRKNTSSSMQEYEMEEEEGDEGEEEDIREDAAAAGVSKVSGAGSGDLLEDDLDSPLHVLSDMAGVMGDKWGDQPGHKRGKRGKRPSSLEVPPAVGISAPGPKSPYRDSLAALHMIAASPSTFAREQMQKLEQGIDGRMAHQGITFIGKVEASRPHHQSQAALLLHERPFGSIFAPPLSVAEVQPGKDLSEATKMKMVAEKLEARMGKSNPKVGKTWLTVARMYQHASSAHDADEEQCREGAAHALSMALQCFQEVTRQHAALSLASKSQESFDYLFERIKRQRTSIAVNKLEQEIQ